MAESVEKIYSEALFQLATEENSLAVVNDELNALAKIFKENPELPKLLSAPTLQNNEKFSVIKNIFEGKLSQTVFNFLLLLTEKGRASYLIKIADAYRKDYYEFKGIAEVTVTTSVELDSLLESKLIDKLTKTLGKEIFLIKKVDPSILGGVILNYGNTMMDGSVKSKLENVGRAISSLIA